VDWRVILRFLREDVVKASCFCSSVRSAGNSAVWGLRTQVKGSSSTFALNRRHEATQKHSDRIAVDCYNPCLQQMTGRSRERSDWYFPARKGWQEWSERFTGAVATKVMTCPMLKGKCDFGVGRGQKQNAALTKTDQIWGND
jgi:hypothetical protein